MTASAAIPHAPATPGSPGRLRHVLATARLAAEGLLNDPGIRNGIKFVLAGTLSFYFALLIRLDEPNWAVTTAFVLSTPKFVGAIAEKTILRIVGALAGAVIGYVITGSLQQCPPLFLLSIGGLVAFTTAMFGGTLAPYGFRQAGYTATLVAAQGLMNPDGCWKVGLARCEEICLGIVVTTIVSTLVWPRFARVEFRLGMCRTLTVLGKQFALRTASFLSGGPVGPDQDVLGSVGGQLARLRKMIIFGRFESAAFRQRRPQVDAVVSRLGALATAISNLGRTIPAESLLRKYIQPQITDLHASFLRAIDCLASPVASATDRAVAMAGARRSLENYQSRLLAMRLDEIGPSIPPEESFEHGGYALSIHEIFEALDTIANLLPELDAVQHESFPTLELRKFTWPDTGWIKSGIRAGLAVAVSFVLLDWLHPPGTDMLVVGTYLFTAFSLESNDRKGDLGVFHQLVLTSLGCLGFFLFLLIATPAMSSYAVMNLVLGTAFFFIGYLTETTRISSFTTLIGLLIIVNLVGINAQHHVTFQAIVSAPLGIILATTLSAVIRRLVWPVLPQHELKARLANILAVLGNSSSHPEISMEIPTRADFALSASDALELSQIIGRRQWPCQLTDQLHSYLRCLARLGGHIMCLLGDPPTTFPIHLVEDYRSAIRQLCAHVNFSAKYQASAVAGVSAPDLPPAIPDMTAWAATCRQKIRDAKLPVQHTIAAMGTLYRIIQVAEAATESASIASSINFQTVFADSKL